MDAYNLNLEKESTCLSNPQAHPRVFIELHKNMKLWPLSAGPIQVTSEGIHHPLGKLCSFTTHTRGKLCNIGLLTYIYKIS